MTHSLLEIRALPISMSAYQKMLGVFCLLVLGSCSPKDESVTAGEEFFSQAETAAYTSATAAPVAKPERWYGDEEVLLGERIFGAHCAVCHGAEAQGIVADWRQRLDNGQFPAPPLNGSAHGWHHPLSVLLQQIENGGLALGGSMPSFGALLSEQEKRAAVAFFQNFWSDEIYQQWQIIDQR